MRGQVRMVHFLGYFVVEARIGEVKEQMNGLMVWLEDGLSVA